jgi:hypothetical protein
MYSRFHPSHSTYINIQLWDVDLVEPANPTDAKAMEVAAQAAVTV